MLNGASLPSATWTIRPAFAQDAREVAEDASTHFEEADAELERLKIEVQEALEHVKKAQVALKAVAITTPDLGADITAAVTSLCEINTTQMASSATSAVIHRTLQAFAAAIFAIENASEVNKRRVVTNLQTLEIIITLPDDHDIHLLRRRADDLAAREADLQTAVVSASTAASLEMDDPYHSRSHSPEASYRTSPRLVRGHSPSFERTSWTSREEARKAEVEADLLLLQARRLARTSSLSAIRDLLLIRLAGGTTDLRIEERAQSLLSSDRFLIATAQSNYCTDTYWPDFSMS